MKSKEPLFPTNLRNLHNQPGKKLEDTFTISNIWYPTNYTTVKIKKWKGGVIMVEMSILRKL